MKLPRRWSRHVAPSGHYYYYNEMTGKSTYEFPDRPRARLRLRGSVWLVATRFGRLFVYDEDTKQSSWELPEIPRADAIVLIARARGLPPAPVASTALRDSADAESVERVPAQAQAQTPGDSDDGEDAFDAADAVDATGATPEEDRQVEIVETERLSEDVHLSDLEDEEDADGFRALLAEKVSNPYEPWEVQRDLLVDDDRYDLLSSNSRRQAVYDEWAAAKKAQSQQAGAASLSDYVALMHEKQRPSFFYLEFKRKFRRDPRFGVAISDREKERLYREYSLLMKRSPQERQEILRKLRQTYGDNKEALEKDPKYIVFPTLERQLAS